MRARAPVIAVSALFVLLAAGLFYNQILRYGYYSRLSRNNSIRVIPIGGSRGGIFDRYLKPLAVNRLSFNVAIVYQEIRDRIALANSLKEVLGFSGEEVIKALERARARPYSPVTVAEDIDRERAFALEEASLDLSGLTVETKARRDYLYGASGSHVLGYLSEITERELEDMRDSGYRMRDLVGRDGVEKQYERYLKGTDGGTQFEVDSRGRRMRVLGVKEPDAGEDIYLTIDVRLQEAADRLLGEHKGAVIMMDPRNGDVLALASHPSFDPNVFIRPNMSGQRLRLLNDRRGRPMVNRAISGIYPPGSVFKEVVASAALDTRKISRYSRFFCGGTYHLGRASFDCWKEGGHGWQDAVSGLMNSCNVFFYNTGRILGPDDIESYARLFGFGSVTGIDLPDEAGGVVPGRSWKRSHKKGAWYEGDTLNYSIGQGYLLVTPVQILDMIAVMANKGSLVRPRIVRAIGRAEVPAVKPRSLGLKESTIGYVRDGLFEVVNNEHGTGKRAKIDGMAVAGKTGTAQNPQGRTHAWFCGFAPFENAKVCTVVFIEHGGKGGLEPAEIARGMFEEARAGGYL